MVGDRSIATGQLRCRDKVEGMDERDGKMTRDQESDTRSLHRIFRQSNMGRRKGGRRGALAGRMVRYGIPMQRQIPKDE